MKKPLLMLMLASVLALAATAQQNNTASEKKKPKATYQIGSVKVTVWENKGLDDNTWKNFVVEKTFKKNDQWKSTNSYNEKELLQLKAVIDKAISEEAVMEK